MKTSLQVCSLFITWFVVSVGFLVPAFGETTNGVPLSVESFLCTQPAIELAEYEIDLPASSPETLKHYKGILEDGTNARGYQMLTHEQKIECSIKRDGTNFLFRRAQDGDEWYAGRLGNSAWHTTGQTLIRKDDSEKKPAPDGFPSWLYQIPMRRFLNLGFQDLVPGTISETGRKHMLKAQSDLSGGGRVDLQAKVPLSSKIDLTYTNGLLTKAIAFASVEPDDKTVVTYKYDASFHDGKFPVSFEVERPAFGSSMTIRIKTLKLAAHGLEPDQLDPMVVLRNKFGIP